MAYLWVFLCLAYAIAVAAVARVVVSRQVSLRLEREAKRLVDRIELKDEGFDRRILMEKMSELGRLTAGLAHELNTPLGAILSSCDTGNRSVPELLAFLDFYRNLAADERTVFVRLVSYLDEPRREASDGGIGERKLRRVYRQVLEERFPEEASVLAENLTDSRYAGSTEELAELMAQAELAAPGRFPQIVDSVHRFSSLVQSGLVIRAAAEKAARVVVAIKNYSRRNDGTNLSSVDVRAQLDMVLTINQNRLKSGIEVIRLYGDVPPVVCYPDKLDQVWMNLIGNAVQAMDFRGRLEIETYFDSDRVFVDIRDDGPGIPPEIQDKIFQPFFTTKKAGEGSGLGLDIASKILNEIGGTIEFESVPGRTCFTVSLKSEHRPG